MHKFGDYFAKQVNLQEYFQNKHCVPKEFYWYENLNFFGEKQGDEGLWITKWTFNQC